MNIVQCNQSWPSQVLTTVVSYIFQKQQTCKNSKIFSEPIPRKFQNLDHSTTWIDLTTEDILSRTEIRMLPHNLCLENPPGFGTKLWDGIHQQIIKKRY